MCVYVAQQSQYHYKETKRLRQVLDREMNYIQELRKDVVVTPSNDIEQNEKELHRVTQRQLHELRVAHRKEKELHQATRKAFDEYCKESEKTIEETKRLKESDQSWKISHEEIKMTKEEIGRGSWGSVAVGVFREQRVAVKQLHDVIRSDHNLVIVNREIDTMSQLHHPNLLLFIGAVLDHPSGCPLIVTEIMDTSLRHAYMKGKLTTNEPSQLSILRDVACGLNYLHCHHDKIIHRDVSSANVLLESKAGANKWRAKLSDFGSANIARKAFTQQVGAAVYSAPETEKLQQQTPKMDVYSYGILACEVMCCRFPESSAVFQTLLDEVRTCYSRSISQIIIDCTNKIPQQRPAMVNVIHKLDKQIQLTQNIN